MASIGRYIGRMLIPQFIQQGLNAARIIENLTSSGYSYRYQDMLRDIREEQQIFEFGSAVRDLPSNRRPPKSIMTETELKQPRKYRVFGTAKYVNVETSRTTYEPVSFYTDTLSTKADWSQEYIERKEESKYREDVTVEGFEIYAIEHFKGFRY